MFRKFTTYFLFILSLLFATLFFLFQGVTLKTLTFPGIEITQLYIKLDKKLIVEIEEIIISKQSKVKSSFDDIKKDLEKLPYYLSYFQEVHIESLKINGNEFIIDVDDEILFIDNKFINIAAKPKFGRAKVSLELYSLYLKDFDTLLEGNIYIDYLNNNTTFKGIYSKQNLKGNLTLNANGNFLNFNLDSNELEDIHFVKDFVSLHPVIEQWMYDNIQGTFKLKNFTGRISAKNFQPILSSFKGSATVSNAKIRFHNDVDYVKTDLITAKFEQDSLSFDLLKPKYKDINIDGSNVVIHNLSGENSNIDINLFSKNKLNQNALDIIKAYGVNLPIIQLDGQTDSKLTINVNFSTNKVSLDGKFQTKKAKFKLDELIFLATDTLVELKDYNVYIKNAQINYKDILDTKLNLNIDTNNSKALGEVSLKSFNIKTPTSTLLDIKDKKSSLNVDFSNDITIELKELFSLIEINEKSFDIKVNRLDEIFDYSQLLQELKVNKGSLDISIYNFDVLDIYFKADVQDVDLPLKKDGKYILDLNLEGTIKKDIIDVNTIDKNISLHYSNELIKLIVKNLDIIFDSNNNKMNKYEQDLILEVQNANINIIDTHSFDVKIFEIKKNKKSIFFNGDVVNLDIPLQKDGTKVNNLSVKGQYVDELLSINSYDENIQLKFIGKNDMIFKIKDYDLLYDSSSNNALENKKIKIVGNNSNIIINNNHKLLSNSYDLTVKNKKITFNSSFKKSSIRLVEAENDYKIIHGNNLPDEFVNSFFNKELISNGSIDFVANGKSDTISGQIKFKDNKVKNLAFINNLILFLNTSPALINPLFAVPTLIGIARNKGIAVDGYKINEGKVEFIYNFDKQIFNAKSINTKGSIVDFEGDAVLNFKDSTVVSTMNVAFMKAYTDIVKNIPIVNYIFLGEDKKITTKVLIKGNLNDPKYETNLGKDSVDVPLDMIERIFKLPGKLLE